MQKTMVIASLALGLCATAAVAGPPIPRDEALKMLAKPGYWVEADGAYQADGTLVAKDFEVYSPDDTLDTKEPAIYGSVAKIDRAQSTMHVLSYVVVWDEKTTLKDENKRKILSSKFSDGDGVKVQGVLQPNGSFKATKIRAHLNQAKNGQTKPKEKVFGPVIMVDARNSIMRILNTTIKVREDAAFQQSIPGQQNN